LDGRFWVNVEANLHGGTSSHILTHLKDGVASLRRRDAAGPAGEDAGDRSKSGGPCEPPDKPKN